MTVEQCTSSNECLANAKVVAAIVVYMPDLDRLKLVVDAVSPQVEVVYMMDNGSDDPAAIELLAEGYENVVRIDDGGNIGISRALNKAALYCAQRGCEYLLTLDQDSVCPRGMVEALLGCFVDERVGMAAPSYYDRRRGAYNPRHSFEVPVSYVEMAITSGSLCAMRAYWDVGGFDDTFFVGCTDDDYCMMLVKSGWLIAQVNSVLLDHELGVVEKKKNTGAWNKLYERTGARTFQKLSYRRTVTAFRALHSARAQVYMRRKHGSSAAGLLRIAKNVIANVVRGRRHLSIFASSLMGVCEGFRIPLLDKRWRGRVGRDTNRSGHGERL